jgi:hypothetical protein
MPHRNSGIADWQDHGCVILQIRDMEFVLALRNGAVLGLPA